MLKNLSLEQRQEIDLLLWFFIMIFAGLIFFFFKLNLPVIIPISSLIVSFVLMARNNKIALKEIKRRKEKK